MRPMNDRRTAIPRCPRPSEAPNSRRRYCAATRLLLVAAVTTVGPRRASALSPLGLDRVEELSAAGDSLRADVALRALSATSILVHLISAYPDGGKRLHLCALESLLNTVVDPSTRPTGDVPHAGEPVSVLVWTSNRTAFRTAHGHVFDGLRSRLSGRQTVGRSVGTALLQLDENLVLSQGPLRAVVAMLDKLGGPFLQQNTANMLRMGLVHRYGGLYADLDFVFVRDPTVKQDFVAYETDTGTNVNNAIFQFRRPGHPWLEQLMEAARGHVANMTSKRSIGWGVLGPDLWTQTAKVCCSKSLRKRPRSDEFPWCRSFAALPMGDTAPVHPFRAGATLTLPPDMLNGRVRARISKADRRKSLLAFHMYSHEAHARETSECNSSRSNQRYLSSLAARVRTRHCPVVFRDVLPPPIPPLDSKPTANGGLPPALLGDVAELISRPLGRRHGAGEPPAAPDAHGNRGGAGAPDPALPAAGGAGGQGPSRHRCVF